MNRLIAENDVQKRSAYVTALHEAYKRREITADEMASFQAASMPWCQFCRAGHSVVLVDGKHICMGCFLQHTPEPRICDRIGPANHE